MGSTHIVTDLGFGDAGKGTMTDAIARRCSSPPLVVRHNGGAQAGHRVVTSDGREHVFAQFGSATFVPGARTLLSKNFILHPPGLIAEHKHLASIGAFALDRLSIDERALVITPYHQAMNRLREAARGADAHGTCGLGIGETVADWLDGMERDTVRAEDLRSVGTIRGKLIGVRNRKLEQIEALLPGLDPANNDLAVIRDATSIDRIADIYEAIGKNLCIVSSDEAERLVRETEHVIFEGAQGVLLDEGCGFDPLFSSGTATTENADKLIRWAEREGPVRRLGVLRAYATRHGQGPFPTEDAKLTEMLGDPENTDGGPQGRWRVGWFDVPLAQYALRACPGITELAITCLDRIVNVPGWKVCVDYDPGLILTAKPGDLAHQEQLTRVLSNHCNPKYAYAMTDPVGYVRQLEAMLGGLPITVTSFGPTAEDKRWR